MRIPSSKTHVSPVRPMRVLTTILVCFLATVTLALADGSSAVKRAPRAVALVQATTAYKSQDLRLSGILYFTEVDDGVHVTGTISGLEPHSVSSLHIHQFGDLSKEDAVNPGGHFNPDRREHAENHQVEDLDTIMVDKNGEVHIDQTWPNLTLGQGPNAIVGRSIVIHEQADDVKGESFESAVPRIAVAIIGWAAPERQ